MQQSAEMKAFIKACEELQKTTNPMDREYLFEVMSALLRQISPNSFSKVEVNREPCPSCKQLGESLGYIDDGVESGFSFVCKNTDCEIEQWLENYPKLIKSID